jgi:hypothetical protein
VTISLKMCIHQNNVSALLAKTSCLFLTESVTTLVPGISNDTVEHYIKATIMKHNSSQ